MRRKIAILGRTGRLGGALCRVLSQKHEVVELGRQEVDLTSSVSEQLKNVEFDLFINTAAITNLDWCEQNPRAAERVNAVAVGELGAICSKRGVRCVHISTDYVFDGSASSPCREEQPASPINVYGKAKRLGEELLLKADNRHLVVRVSWVFGPDKPSFIDVLLDRAVDRERVEAIDDKYSAPTYSLDFAEWIEPILFEVPLSGILHLCNTGGCSWREYGQAALDAAADEGIKLKTHDVLPISLESMSAFVARRPIYTVMDQQRYRETIGASPRHWKEAVRSYVRNKYPRVINAG
jgi:dTDP-4-dehydrorhamnose reductase